MSDTEHDKVVRAVSLAAVLRVTMAILNHNIPAYITGKPASIHYSPAMPVDEDTSFPPHPRRIVFHLTVGGAEFSGGPGLPGRKDKKDPRANDTQHVVVHWTPIIKRVLVIPPKMQPGRRAQ